MKYSQLITVAVLLGLWAPVQSSWGTVILRFEPPHGVHNSGDDFTIDIVADISSPVIGWGLDLTIGDGTIASTVGLPALGAPWSPVQTPDGDGLAGIAFPNSVTGNDVLLATLTFSADKVGQTDLLLSITPSDLNEGFPLESTGFAELTFLPGQITIIPEPAALSLFTVGVFATFWRRRYA